MKIVFIGAGNLATNLARELYSKGHQILQVYSRTEESAKALAKSVGSMAITNIAQTETGADLYVFSVKDSVLEQLLAQMPTTSGLWVHTAGSMPLSVFGKYHDDHGVIYPFQTFSKERKVDFSEIPVFIEANSDKNLELLENWVKTFSRKAIPLSSEKRKHIHLCGVFACNFVNHLYAVAEDILASQDIQFDVLLPLIDETARKVHELSPKDAQTGPAIRYDENVINKHLSLLANGNQKLLYELLSKNIHETNKTNK
jgi:predicted short-subunit dehydrogenase-like oxidoreductase (DUF2520 family)